MADEDNEIIYKNLSFHYLLRKDLAMRFNEFKEWLENQSKMSSRLISDCLSRNKRIVDYLDYNLDFEYESDRGIRLITLLTYTKEDKRNNLPSPIPINGDYFERLASLKSAVKKYFNFCKENSSRREKQ